MRKNGLSCFAFVMVISSPKTPLAAANIAKTSDAVNVNRVIDAPHGRAKAI
jgi:hypothetical protein